MGLRRLQDTRILMVLKVTELDSYQTLVRPLDLSLFSAALIRYNGITAGDVVSCPTFSEIVDKVYDILQARVWAGLNIVEFDCVRLKEAYAQINQKLPVPKGTMDTLKLLTGTFGRRTDNMKVYYCLGGEKR
ncbi:putative ribonuclease H-like superfamily, exonuclease, RNase T/DNA polymerase III [Helianthus annuus]|nr:putative ribonuclease H-like superfamily, exonuclease, RNase T/DNA polymerase III [Helianthus annuus]KAJ0894463.1 putative ribonuclease H-like superfamily, exonuclease, RNase T/DNA polymerase III [Helianthus annuus]